MAAGTKQTAASFTLIIPFKQPASGFARVGI